MGMLEDGDGSFRSSSKMPFVYQTPCPRSQGFVSDIDCQVRILGSPAAGLNAVEENEEGGRWLNGQLRIGSLGDIRHHQ